MTIEVPKEVLETLFFIRNTGKIAMGSRRDVLVALNQTVVMAEGSDIALDAEETIEWIENEAPIDVWMEVMVQLATFASRH